MSRSIRILTLLLLGLTLAACSSSPSQETSSTTAGGESATSGEQAASEQEVTAVGFDPIKCVRHRPVGTRISQKVCKKMSEWERIREQNQRDMQDVQRRSVHENTTL